MGREPAPRSSRNATDSTRYLPGRRLNTLSRYEKPHCAGRSSRTSRVFRSDPDPRDHIGHLLAVGPYVLDGRRTDRPGDA